MKDSIEKRAKLVRDSETPEDLRKHLCPFFEKGGHPDCTFCKKTEADLEECRDYYIERIVTTPLDIWDESFDKTTLQNRDLVELSDVVGVGINCDSCYMSDKCPLYKRGYVCGIKWDDKRPTTPGEFIDFLINTQFERVKRASVFEKIDGGVPDANLSSEMDRLTGFISMKDNMGRDRLSISVEASGASKSSGGILSKLFGGGSSDTKAISATPESFADAVEIPTFEEIREPKKLKK